MNKYEKHFEICKKLNQVYKDKNTAYGDAFGKSFKKRGVITAFTRMEDKWNRFEALIEGAENNTDESIKDTVEDLANYCIMTLIEMEN